jgi:hypothetical protein
VRFNEEVDWPGVFRGFIRQESLADPGNRRRSPFIVTMLFVEAGLRELDDQLIGRSPVRKEGLTWARITRDVIVRRARRILAELPAAVRRGARVGEGGFKHRWPDLGGMSNFFMCMVRYACTDPKWRRILGSGPQRALAALPRVRAGELSLAELIEIVARHDLRMWARLARCWLFPLLLTMDTTWAAVGRAAFGELLSDYSKRWVPVYEEGMRQFAAELRPDMSPALLSGMVSAQINGSAMAIAGRGRSDDGDIAQFVQAVQALIYAAVDPGDGRKVPAALEARAGVRRGDQVGPPPNPISFPSGST